MRMSSWKGDKSILSPCNFLTPSHGRPRAWIRLLDQTRLPDEERYLELETVDAAAEAISSLRVRGAPLIGIAAGMGVTPAVRRSARLGRTTRLDHARRAMATSSAPARPRSSALGSHPHGAPGRAGGETGRAAGGGPARRGAGDLGRGPRHVRADRRARCRAGPGDRPWRLSATPACWPLAESERAGADLPPAPSRPRAAGHRARDPPLLQGAGSPPGAERAGVECTGGRWRDREPPSPGDVACALVGADRIAANGDVANKVGTYAPALAARAHRRPALRARPELDDRSGDARWRRDPDRAPRRGRSHRLAQACRSGEWRGRVESRVRCHPRRCHECDRDRSGVVPPGQLSRLMD